MADDEQVETPDPETPDEPTEPTIDEATYVAKIAELTAALTEAGELLAAAQTELLVQKAANYDLLIATPGDGEVINPDDVDDSDVDVSDFFGKDD